MKGTVLVIDDDISICDVLKSFLENAGFTVLVANDGYSAVGAAVGGKPDAILLDMQMPAGGGQGVYEHLAANVHTNMTPIFLTTSLSEDEVKDLMPKDVRYKGYFQKPVNLDLLLVKLLAVVPKR